ncbi:MAG: hypothetical protein ACC656_15045, partial [Candidatus Heimdallarchaeota archaeon]
YLGSYPKLKEWMENSKKKAQIEGFVKSEAGRVRHLPRVKELFNIYGDSLLSFKFRNKIVLLFTRYTQGLEIKIFDLDDSSWVEIDEPIIDYLAESEWNSFVFNPTNYEIMYQPYFNSDRGPENFTLSFDLVSKKWIKREYSKYPSDTKFMGYLYHSGIKKYVGMGGKIISSGLETKDIWIYDPNLNEWDNDDRLPEKFSRVAGNMVYNPVDSKIYVFGGVKENKRLFDLFSFSLEGSGFGETLEIDDRVKYIIPVGLLIIFVIVGLIIKRKNRNLSTNQSPMRNLSNRDIKK